MLPRDVTTITLSYTFFELGAGAQSQLGAARDERGG
jgi:cytochrome c oxidase assembly protein Cox11